MATIKTKAHGEIYKWKCDGPDGCGRVGSARTKLAAEHAGREHLTKTQMVYSSKSKKQNERMTQHEIDRHNLKVNPKANAFTQGY